MAGHLRVVLTLQQAVNRLDFRRKRIPYAANGRIDDAAMAVKEALRLSGMALKEKDPAARALQIASVCHELSQASTDLVELKLIQQIEE